MSQPTNADEFNARYNRNLHYENTGLQTTTHIPCPFCAAPDFMVFRVLRTTEAMELGGTCRECGRSSRSEVTRKPGEVSFEIVQTGGADPPDYMPKMRRVVTVPGP